MIKNIIFDLGGVFVSLNRDKCLSAFNKDLGFPNFGDYINPYLQTGFFGDFEEGMIDSAQFRDQVRKHCSVDNIPDSLIDSSLEKFLVGIDKSKIDFLLSLKGEYNLYLLSNINPILWEKSKKFFKDASGIDMEDVYNKIYLSFEMKTCKPGIEIYDKLIADSGIIPSETLFIDDGKANVESGEKAGLISVLYDVNTSLKDTVLEALKNNG